MQEKMDLTYKRSSLSSDVLSTDDNMAPKMTEDCDLVIPITPTAISLIPHVITPSDDSSSSQTQVDTLERELKEARQDAKFAFEALSNFTLGIRTITRLMQRGTSSVTEPLSPTLTKNDDSCLERSTSPDSPSTQDDDLLIQGNNQDLDSSRNRGVKCGKQEDCILLDLLQTKLDGLGASDLLAFINAADMVREHARLASEEASLLVEDVQHLQSEAQKANDRAAKAETITRKLYKENVVLKKDSRRIRLERRALIKEVKSLRDEVEFRRRFDTWRNLEEHILGAIQVHENCLNRGVQKGEESPTAKQKHGDSEKGNGDDNNNGVTGKGTVENTSKDQTVTHQDKTYQQAIECDHESSEGSTLVGIEEKLAADDLVNVKKPVESDTVSAKKQPKKGPASAETSSSVPTVRTRVGFGGYVGLKYRSLGKKKAGLSASVKAPQQGATNMEDENKPKDDFEEVKKPLEVVTGHMDEPKAQTTKRLDEATEHKEMKNAATVNLVSAADNTDYVPVKLCSSAERTPPISSHRQKDDNVGFRMKSFFSGNTPSPAGSAPKSPLITIDDATACLTDDSLSDSTHEEAHEETNEKHSESKLLMPKNVSIEVEKESPPSNLPTPMFTPEASPPGIVVPDQKPLCDPKILRTLAIPSDSDELCDGEILPSPRVCVGHGLYEC